ncbi:MAG: gluconate 2-dehydrogenase subunit 3 family protein [Betaproteobacteria bacterium]|nr:gluconate 2-dehydrogenase subunit 3 family protein [Betaproteobacteria bacterium]
MKNDRDKAGPKSRRSFLKGAGATFALAGVAAAPASGIAQTSPTAAPGAAAPGSAAAAGYQSLGLEEAAITEALVEHMWPADQFTASGVELGIATYIDRQLAGAFGRGDRLYAQGPFRKGKAQHGYQLPLTPEAWYKTGVGALSAYCRRTHGKTFDRLPAPEREAVLQAVSTGKANAPDVDLSAWFNGLFYPLFTQGGFADPIYGGNRGKAAWKMIGYPGLPAVYNRDIVIFRGKRHPKSDAPKSIQDLS